MQIVYDELSRSNLLDNVGIGPYSINITLFRNQRVIHVFVMYINKSWLEVRGPNLHVRISPDCRSKCTTQLHATVL